MNKLTVINYITSCRDYLVTISKVLIPTTITTTVKIQQQSFLNFYCKKLTYDNSIKAICYQGWLSIITYISTYITQHNFYHKEHLLQETDIHISILLFESIAVLWMLKYSASRPNHTSYRKLYLHEFVANVLRDNMSLVVFDLRGYGGC